MSIRRFSNRRLSNKATEVYLKRIRESIIEFDKINNLFVVAMKIAADEEGSSRKLT